MNIVKWSPFRELEDIQTRLNRFFNETPFADWAPPVDIQETDQEYLIKAELPELHVHLPKTAMVKPKAIEVKVA